MPVNTTKKGDALEIAVFNLLEAQIDTDRFFARKDCCRIFRRKGYYSEKRKANIIFDISIEISFPGASDYSVLILVECKSYAKTVPVDDVEEFFAKVEQAGVANTKGIFISNNALQSSALSYCKSQGMGVARYFDGQDRSGSFSDLRQQVLPASLLPGTWKPTRASHFPITAAPYLSCTCSPRVV